ncbi:MAG: hypothetical protein ACE1ZF_02370 [Gemmatimonadales bacterium]
MNRHRSILFVILPFLLLPAVAEAQYFGQNRVRYRSFDFLIVETAHFDVYYYDDFRDAAMDAARMAERAYARLARTLHHEYRERQPIVLFASHTEFQQNNLIDISEGVQGVTDAIRHRVMLPFTGSYEDFDHVLQHELVHQFQFDIFARGRIGAAVERMMFIQPPLWFTEGIAEYLSLGPVNALTAMWLRDAALNETLPTIEQLTTDSRIFPYRYGHALFAYIAERWGDEAVGEIMHGVASSGIAGGFGRALRISLDQLSKDWHDAVRSVYFAKDVSSEHPLDAAIPVLTRERSKGGLHISPVLSPDGSQIVYFSDGGSLFIDLYLADVASGRIDRRLVRSAFSAEMESLRFLNSAGAWSPDGRFLAFPAKNGGRDDLIIFDTVYNRIHRRINIPVAGITNPDWSPFGNQLVFTGLSGGRSDLFVVDIDGTNLRQLTSDRYAALHPAWSPDGRSIAFVTDRGPQADLDNLRTGPSAIALFHLDTGVIEVLPDMDGSNINPQWSPDGTEIAFVSDRTGVANLFIHEIEEGETYQLTNVYTGISGITEKSPAISWASRADRLAMTYYENGEYNVYVVDDPRALKGEPYRSPRLTADPVAAGAERADPPPRNTNASSTDFIRPLAVSVRALLDSALMELPDTGSFGFRRYHPTLHLDYVVQPTIGYQRDNFGSGVFGGTAMSLSDLLGNRRLIVGGQVNGRIEEAQLLAVYANSAHRTAWAVGYEQAPTFFYQNADILTDPATGQQLVSERIQRFIVHRAFVEAYHPFSRFERLEGRLSASNVSSAQLNFQTLYDPVNGLGFQQNLQKISQGSFNYVQPSLALVYDNSVSLWNGPYLGRRSRFEYAPAFGQWNFHQTLADYRRYDQIAGPVTLATRLLFFGRFGRDSRQFPVFLGTPEFIRGYTSGSFRRRECHADNAAGFDNTCGELFQLIGTRLGVFNAELRFPIANQLVFKSLPPVFPPLEGALFFDAGVTWQDGTALKLTRNATDDLDAVRAPLASWGLSLRANFFGFMILRGDYAKPISRDDDGAYWTISFGPMF